MDTIQQRETKSILEIAKERDRWKAEAERWRKIKEPQWQPIETAPKDETVVLVYDDVWKVLIARYINGAWWGKFTSRTLIPTHWMPLPQAPQ